MTPRTVPHAVTIGLNWVKNELDLALSAALELFAQEQISAQALQQCRQYMSCTAGVLEVVNLPAEARFAHEIGTLLERLINRELEASPALSALLEESIGQLSGHLADLAAGLSVSSLSLFGAYVRLQNARGQETASPVDLFYPKPTVRLPPRIETLPADSVLDPIRMKTHQQRFHAALTAWQETGATDALLMMRQAIADLERSSQCDNWRRFWWTTLAFFDCLEAVPAGMDPAIRALLNRIGLQIRKHMFNRESPTELDTLARELLFRIMQTDLRSPCLDVVRHLYQLGRSLDLAPAELPAGGRLQVRQLRRIAGSACKRWIRICCGDMELMRAFLHDLGQIPTQLRQLQRPALADLADATRAAVSALPAHAPPETPLPQAVAAILLHIVQAVGKMRHDDPTQAPAQQDRLLQQLRDGLQVGQEAIPVEPGDQAAAELITAARQHLQQAAAGSRILQQLKQAEILLDRFFRNTEERAGLSLVRLALSDIETTLNWLDMQEAAANVRQAIRLLDRMPVAPFTEPDEAHLRLAAMLSGLAIALAELPAGENRWLGFPQPNGSLFLAPPPDPEQSQIQRDIAIQAAAYAASLLADAEQSGLNAQQRFLHLGDYCRMLGATTAAALADVLASAPDALTAPFAQEATDCITGWLRDIAAGESPAVSQEWLYRAQALLPASAPLLSPEPSAPEDAHLPSDAPPPETAEAILPLAEREMMSVPPESAAPAAVDQLDDSLAPIFLEEAHEIVPNLNRLLRNWRVGNRSLEEMAELKRLLHTLKGSARMAGLQSIGQIAHDMESDVIRVMEDPSVPDHVMDSLERKLDVITARLDLLRPGTANDRALPAPTDPVPVLSGAAAPINTPDSGISANPAPSAAEGPLRVNSTVLDELVDDTGELTISRARLHESLSVLHESMDELGRHLDRLQHQIREIEIHADSHIASRPHPTANESMFDPLEFDRFTRLHELTRSISECANDIDLVRSDLGHGIGQLDTVSLRQNRLLQSLQQRLMDIRMVPFGSVAERFYQVVRLACRETAKEAELLIQGGETLIDRSILERVVPPIEHLLRNAVDHGIEPAAGRQQAGKPPRGQLTLAVHTANKEIHLELADDGHGIDRERVRHQAVARGLLKEGEDLPDQRLMQLIFQSGFSTADKITQLSGRGIGLDVAQNAIVGAGGRMEIASTPGKGTRFVMTLPQSTATLSVMLVEIKPEIYALPAALVAGMATPDVDQLRQATQAGVWQDAGGEWPLHPLDGLLGLARPAAGSAVAIMLLAHQHFRLAIKVDAVLGTQDVLIKNAGPLLHMAPTAYGATVLGDGREVIILNPIQLARLSQHITPASWLPAAGNPIDPTPLVLIVDDSLTVRKVTSNLLQREGFQVEVASDGVDAIDKLMRCQPDIVLVDIEMPRMDGFELTRHLRATPATARTPIIMITSRTADKHRQHALGLGVDVYLGKPWREDELLNELRRLLNARTAAGPATVAGNGV